MKLIDVLVMISKGELKEGTKIIWGKLEYIFADGELEREGNDEMISIFEDMYCINLDEEVELIEPTDNTTEKIEELVADKINGKSLAEALSIIGGKLNEVIRYINKEG